MYRQMKLLEINIYCPKTICDRRCGKFHTKSVKTIVNGLKGILIHNGDLHSNQKSSSRRQSIRSRRTNFQRLNSLDSLASSTTKQCLNSSQLSIKNLPQPLTTIHIITPSKATTPNPGPSPSSSTSSHNALSPNAASIVAQHNLQNGTSPISPQSATSTVTLDDIIASARRKISQDMEGEDYGMPPPVHIMENGDADWFNDKNGKNIEKRSPNEPLSDEERENRLAQTRFIESLLEYDSSEDDMWTASKPPLIMGDEDQEDFVELLSATKPPDDYYSNPINKASDALTRRRNKTFEDDNSSIDMSLADISGSQLSLNLHLALHQSAGGSSTGSARPEYEENL
ncbi:hypothetical protein DdX_12975 [Ditylenchus destructor]|uniref:Uncharacterized protein n=1 Tax=Ditylenchus destructor TaxID=166010 RepID=A0AAD4MXL7_9BILA|nr:hypothetical protein DdX_12975 [Ditylenchus destructor]